MFSVVAICNVLHMCGFQISHSAYYEYLNHKPSKREIEDNRLMILIKKIWVKNFCCYGVRKMYRALHKQGETVAKSTVERLMKIMELRGTIRGKITNHKNKAKEIDRPLDLVHRKFNPTAPNRLWVADFTYVWTRTGWAYVAFIIDAFARTIVGCKISPAMTKEFVMAALDKAVNFRKNSPLNDLSHVIHHNDAGSQYMSIKFVDKLEDNGILQSVGSVGDSYDNALAETVNGLYKTELIKNREGGWDNWQDVEFETLKYVKWFNEERISERNHWDSPLETEQNFCRENGMIK
jgi:putative transposase